MKPAAFDYLRPETLDAAVDALGRHGGEAKLLAGGQSLVPLLNFRLLHPSVLIDINRLPGLDRIERDEGGKSDGGRALKLGALVRHRALETSALVARHFPIVPAVMAHVAHLAIRNRGTLGGSLSHADPAAELPLLALLLEAEINARGPAGSRRIRASEFLVGTLATALAEDEILTGVSLPLLPSGAGWGFAEVSLRRGDFAIAAAGAILIMREGRIEAARLALMGVHETALRAPAAEAILVGESPRPGLIEAVATAATSRLEPMNDLHASAAYRRHLAGVLVRRVIEQAFARAEAGVTEGRGS